MFFLQINNFKSAFVAAGRVSEVIAFEHEPSGGERHVPQGTITFQNVRFSYKADTPVLKGVSFTARKGETHAFVGKTGCGKSTIMNVLLRFYPHQEGSILFDGRAVESLDSAALRSKIAVVLQEPYLFTGTLFDNIGTVQHADVINVIEDGIITEQGSHEQLLALGKSYAAWYTLQTGKEEHG